MKQNRIVFLLFVLTVLSVFQNLYSRTINFSGYTWTVKSSTSPTAPGNNYFGGDVSNVWADSSGLHMTISSSAGHWWCTEVYLPSSLGYGTYFMHTLGRFDLMDKYIVSGFFTYETDTREIDIEFARWGSAGANVCNYTVQPSDNSSHKTYPMNQSDSNQALTLIITWTSSSIYFATYYGYHTLGNLSPSDLVAQWTYVGSYNPPAGGERWRMNYWLYSGHAPTAGGSFTLTDFFYYPVGYQPPTLSPPLRYLWCWSTESITNNLGSARSDFYSFCTAPFGDTTKAITGLYYSSYADVTGNPATLRNFLTEAHSKGYKVLYLDGDPNWVSSSANRVSAESIVDTVLSFNMAGTSTQRFDGIQYDVDPTSLPGWAGNESTYWSTFTTLLINCQSKVTAYNVSYTPTMYFEETIPWSHDSDGDPITNSNQIQSIVDSVALLDYVNNSAGIINNAMGEVTYGDANGKKVILGVDTRNVVPISSTFYGLGNPYMETQLTSVNNTFSSHSSYRGIAVQYYDTYNTLFSSSTSTAVSYGGVIWDFDSTATTPIAVTGFSYIKTNITSYIANGKGIGGSKALDVFAYAHTRTWGSGVKLVPASPLDLSVNTVMYGWIAADTSNPFGAAFEVLDNSGNTFIPQGFVYTSQAEQFPGSINDTFKKVAFNLSAFHLYSPGQTTGPAPNLSAITAMVWNFTTNMPSGSVTGPIHFYLDNIGASTNVPITDWSIYAPLCFSQFNKN